MGRLSNTEEHRERNREYQRKWYAKNREIQNARVRKNQARAKEQIKAHVLAIKQLGCERCSENDPVCIDFHHKDPGQKELAIAKVMNGRWSIARVDQEIAKCMRLCSNCHRKLHAYGGA